MLGQHVYVEADYGQGDVKEGLWLDEYYIMQEDDELPMYGQKMQRDTSRSVK